MGADTAGARPSTGRQIALGSVADVRIASGPPMLRDGCHTQKGQIEDRTAEQGHKVSRST